MRARIADKLGGLLADAWKQVLLPRIREHAFDERYIASKGGRRMLDLFEHSLHLGKIRCLRERMPQFDPAKSNVSWLPINREIEGAGEIALPVEVLDRFIEKAKHRVIVNFCGCRAAMHCKDYPVSTGCLMMGESALHIPAKSRREVGVEEAKAHVRKAIDAGLIPVTGKARVDNDFLLIPDEGKLLTVCLCCECCCVARFSRHVPLEVLEKIHRPVEGLSIEVTDDCVGCGTCVSKCYIEAIRLDGTRAVIGDMCRVCGRCAMHCPQKAIRLKLDNPKAVDDVVRRIESAVSF